MGAASKIEWTDASWNPVRAGTNPSETDGGKVYETFGWHCEHVSAGCRNCYAEGINKRLGTKLDFKPGNRDAIDIFLDEKLLSDPLRWKKPRSIFLSSMTDVFADFVSDEMLDRMFAAMALSPQHFFRILTKRPKRMRDYMTDNSAMRNTARAAALAELAVRFRPGLLRSGAAFSWPLSNVGLGVSVEDQASADERLPLLLATPAAMRFVSAEPLLGPVDLTRVTHRDPKQFAWLSYDPTLNALTGNYPLLEGFPARPHPCRLDEVICGGESGTHARPMHPDWARSLRDQCARAAQASGGAQSRASAQGPAFFFKQWGEWLPAGEAYRSLGYDVVNNCHLGEFHGGKEWIDGCMCAEGDADMPMFRVGKKVAGARLDGVEHRAVAPQVTAHFARFAPPHPSAPAALPPSPSRGEGKSGEAR